MYVTITDADIGSLTSLHTLFGKYLNHMLVKFEQNYGTKFTTVWAFWQKMSFEMVVLLKHTKILQG